MSLARGAIEDHLGRFIGLERLALPDAERPQLIDHDAVALEPRLALHVLVEDGEEATIVRDCGVHEHSGEVDEHRLRRVVHLGQWVEPYLPGIGDCRCDEARAAARTSRRCRTAWR